MIGAQYSHAGAVNALFGIRGAAWFLEKARRDLARYRAADDERSRAEALLDLCAAVIAIEDWSYSVGQVAEAAWRTRHRDASPEHAVLALIALVAKHREVRDGRFSQMRLDAGSGTLRLWTEDASPDAAMAWMRSQAPTGHVVASVRTVVDDDQIQGYEISISMPGLIVDGRPQVITAIAERAIGYWEPVVAS